MIKIHHFGVKVQDVERARDFYTRVLGLQTHETVDLNGNKFYFVGDGELMLEIEQAYAPGPREYDNGFGHLALTVDDIEATAAHLRAHAVSFVLEPCQLRDDRKIAFIADPEGNLLQLIEFIK